MFDFVCKKCGEIQKPQKEGEKFNSFGTTCQKCGGELKYKCESKRGQRNDFISKTKGTS